MIFALAISLLLEKDKTANFKNSFPTVNATTSCKNVETVCAKNGFTYFYGSQIANLSQKNI